MRLHTFLILLTFCKASYERFPSLPAFKKDALACLYNDIASGTKIYIYIYVPQFSESFKQNVHLQVRF